MPKTIYAYRFGHFQLDAAKHRLLRQGAEVPLQLRSKPDFEQVDIGEFAFVWLTSR